MKDPRVKYGQAVSWRKATWRIVAQVIAPEETVYVADKAGELPGRQIPAAEWAEARWDFRLNRWEVPAREAA